jgi:hypothetical protein
VGEAGVSDSGSAADGGAAAVVGGGATDSCVGAGDDGRDGDATRVMPWLEAARLTREWGPEMTAEMVTAARMMSERTAAGKVVADRVEERAEKLASLLEGIG